MNARQRAPNRGNADADEHEDERAHPLNREHTRENARALVLHPSRRSARKQTHVHANAGKRAHARSHTSFLTCVHNAYARVKTRV